MKKFILDIDPERCKGCGLCVHFCPAGKIKLGSKLNSKAYRFAVSVETDCTGCGICFRMCPDSALEISEETE